MSHGGQDSTQGMGQMRETYTLTIRFIGGILEGLTHTNAKSCYMKPGTKILKPIGGSPYVVVSCTKNY